MFTLVENTIAQSIPQLQILIGFGLSGLIARVFAQFIEAIILICLLFFYALSVIRHHRESSKRSIRYLLLIPLCLFIRELSPLIPISIYWQQFLLRNVSFLLVAVYLGWFASFARSWRATISFLILYAVALSLGLIAGLGLVSMYDFVPQSFYTEASGILRVYTIYSNLLMVASFFYLLAQSYFAIFIGNSQEVKKIRVLFLLTVGSTIILNLIPVVRESFFVLNIFMPLSLAVHLLPFWGISTVDAAVEEHDSVLRDTAVNNLFDFLREIGGALLSHQMIDRILDFFMHTVRDATEADGGVALLLDDFNENLEVRCLLGFYPPPYEVPVQVVKSRANAIEAYFKSFPIPEGETIFWQVFKERETKFYQTLTGSQRTQIYGNDPSVQDVNSLIIIPLVVEDRAFGIISLVKSGQGSRFSEENFNHANILTRYASLIIENRHNYLQMLEKRQIEREVDIASGIQESLIPQRIPQHQYIEVATFTKPLKGVSGDYFDVITHEKEGRVSVLICDVAGKGIPASLLMVMIRTAFHLIMERGISEEGEVVSEINRLVEHTTAVDLFATLSLYTYVPSRKCITYSSGGHLPMIVYREKEGKVEHFEALGLPIGIDGSFQYQTQEIAVGEGDYVVLYTDGIVETRNEENEEYGIERLSEGICEKAKDTAAAKELLEGLIQDLSTFQDEKETTDDRTLIAARVRSKAAS